MSSESLPLRLEDKSSAVKDLEHPGAPTIIIGILFIMQTNAVKVFYLSARFIAIDLSLYILVK
jgi:hypothetical protein